ncbi:MAG: sterol desaturase family protein [Bdellovibrionota bacterium]
MIMTITGVLNHTGFEIYPKGLASGRWGRYVIGATHHSLHHRKFHRNYGLYVSVLDHWFGTEDPDYAETYKKVVARRVPYLIEVCQPRADGLKRCSAVQIDTKPP